MLCNVKVRNHDILVIKYSKLYALPTSVVGATFTMRVSHPTTRPDCLLLTSEISGAITMVSPTFNFRLLAAEARSQNRLVVCRQLQ